MEIKKILSIWKEVFSNWKYSTSALLIFLVFYSVNVLISNFGSITSYYSRLGFLEGTRFFLTLFFGFKYTITISSFVSLILIGILLSMFFTLIAYKTNIAKMTSRKIGFFGTMGIFLGVLAPGCAACGIGLLPILGISVAVITFLPFNGLELSWLAIGILGYSIFKISKDIKKGIVCEI